MDKPSIIETVLVRDVRTDADWFEDAKSYAQNPISGTIVVREKPKPPVPVICEARYYTALGPAVDPHAGDSHMRKVMREQFRERFLRGE